MRFSQEEKYEIIRLIEDSELGVNRTLRELQIPKRTFYNWYGKYKKDGYNGLAPKNRAVKSQWNRIPDQVRNEVVEYAQTAYVDDVDFRMFCASKSTYGTIVLDKSNSVPCDQSGAIQELPQPDPIFTDGNVWLSFHINGNSHPSQQ